MPCPADEMSDDRPANPIRHRKREQCGRRGLASSWLLPGPGAVASPATYSWHSGGRWVSGLWVTTADLDLVE
jgi:hypothetical protein